jgi:Xaa-Pro aminopeptidase
MSEPTQSVRERLRAGAEEQGDKIEAFFSAALDAEREVWTTCEKCQRRTAVVVPDWSSRLKAVEALIDQGYGKTKAVQAEEEPTVILVERNWPEPTPQVRELLSEKELALIERAQDIEGAARAKVVANVKARRMAGRPNLTHETPTGSTS